MYLIDTNVISEQRKKNKVNLGVGDFFKQLIAEEKQAYISVITLGELRRGVELIRHRGDEVQARFLEKWLLSILNEYADSILDFTAEESQVWGRLRIPHHENAMDKQIAATALIYGLTLVTRNVNDFAGTGVKLLNPFS
jgi:predicted nucleic acid-binding protein